MSFSRSSRGSFIAGAATFAAALSARASAQTPLEVPVAVDVDPSLPGTPIPSDFLGLSFESERLAEPTFFNPDNTSLVALFRRLGSGLVLRLGGASLERVLFTNGAAPAGSDRIAIGPPDVARLAAFLNTVGWRAIYGIGLARGNPNDAATEAAAVVAGLGARLAAFEIGNEPDRYAATGLRPPSYGYPEYSAEFSAFATAIGFRAPAARIAGPDVAVAMPWVDAFARERRGALLTRHYYAGAPDDPAFGLPSLFTPATGRDAMLAQLRADAGASGGGFRLTELNTVPGAGKAGVSDVFASALWALDTLFAVAAAGGAGVNVHGQRTALNAPFIADETGTHAVRPIFYALLAFAGASRGRLVAATPVHKELNLGSYAVRGDDGTTAVTLVNKDLAQEARVTIDVHRPLTRVEIARLRAPAVDAIRDITFAGSAVGLDGSFTPRTPESVAATGTTVAVRVPPASAAIVTLG